MTTSTETFANVTYGIASFSNIVVTETDVGTVGSFTSSPITFVGTAVPVPNVSPFDGIQWSGFQSGAYAPGSSTTLNISFNVASTSPSEGLGQMFAAFQPDAQVGSGISIDVVEKVYSGTTLVGEENLNLGYTSGQPGTQTGDIPMTGVYQNLTVDLTITASVAANAPAGSLNDFSILDVGFTPEPMSTTGSNPPPPPPPPPPAPPTISVDKIPGSMVVNANGSVTYTVDVTNTGTTSITGLSLVDNIGTASKPIYVTLTAETKNGYNVGDTNDNGVMNAGETWVYTVTVPVSELGITSTSSGSSGNCGGGSNENCGPGLNCGGGSGCGSDNNNSGANCGGGSNHNSGSSSNCYGGSNENSGSSSNCYGGSSCGSDGNNNGSNCYGGSDDSHGSSSNCYGGSNGNSGSGSNCYGSSSHGSDGNNGGSNCYGGSDDSHGSSSNCYGGSGSDCFGGSSYGGSNCDSGSGHGSGSGSGSNCFGGSGSDCYGGSGSNCYGGSGSEGSGSNCGSSSSSTTAYGSTSIADTVTVTATTATGATVTASDSSDVVVVGTQSSSCGSSSSQPITVNGTAPTGSLNQLFGTAEKIEFIYNPANNVSVGSGGSASVSGSNSLSQAFVLITNNANPHASNATIYEEGTVSAGAKIYADATVNELTNTQVPAPNNTMSTASGADLYAYVYASQAAYQAGAAAEQTMVYSTASNHSMHIGDTIGSLQVAGYVGTSGGHLVS